MKYLIFDCETTGLPPWGRSVSAGNVNQWPHIVSLAWAVFNQEKELVEKRYHVIKPDGYKIPKESSQVHGITTDYALKHGEPLDKVISEFLEALIAAETVIAHNLSFDREMVRAECLRLGIKTKANIRSQICTMESSVDFCAIPFPNGRGFKYPKLEELYQKLFNNPMKDAHNAMADVEACAECFFELVEREVLALG